jgi:peroxiredoxin
MLKHRILGALAFTAITLVSPFITHAVPVGQAAPAFTLTDTKGTSHNLADFKGKVVVLEWTNPECPFVVKHYSQGHMQALQKETTAKGVVWLSICSSAPGKQGQMSPADWNKTITDKNIAATAVLLDESGKVGKLYDAKTTPHMFVINKDGVLVYAGAIDSVKSTDAADIAKATNHVKVAVDEVLAGKPVSTSSTTPYGCSVKYVSVTHGFYPP